MSEKLLEVKNLRVSYHTYAGEVQSVRGVSFTVNKARRWPLWVSPAAASLLRPRASCG